MADATSPLPRPPYEQAQAAAVQRRRAQQDARTRRAGSIAAGRQAQDMADVGEGAGGWSRRWRSACARLRNGSDRRVSASRWSIRSRQQDAPGMHAQWASASVRDAASEELWSTASASTHVHAAAPCLLGKRGALSRAIVEAVGTHKRAHEGAHGKGETCEELQRPPCLAMAMSLGRTRGKQGRAGSLRHRSLARSSLMRPAGQSARDSTHSSHACPSTPVVHRHPDVRSRYQKGCSDELLQTTFASPAPRRMRG
jgi:hypothetical protein